MKRTVAILVGVILAGHIGYASAAVMTDDELGALYAGDFAINDVVSENSAVADQSNISAAVAYGNISYLNMANYNSAEVTNTGNSAVALQSNIGGIFALNSCVGDSSIENSNDALADNLIDSYTDGLESVNGGGVEATSIAFGSHGINLLSVYNTAIASQSNIGAIFADGNIDNSSICNTNTAIVVQ